MSDDQPTESEQDPAVLTLEQIFSGKGLATKGIGPMVWLEVTSMRVTRQRRH